MPARLKGTREELCDLQLLHEEEEESYMGEIVAIATGEIVRSAVERGPAVSAERLN